MKVNILPLDLSAPDAARSLVDQVAARGLGIDVLINNAGFGLVGRFAGLSPDRQAEMVDLNIRSLTSLCRLVLPGMIERGRGAILNVASTGAFQPGPGFAVYFATKAYVLSFTEALHEEFRGTGIRVTALCPGPTSTEFGQVAGFHDGRFDRFAGHPGPVVAAGLAGLDGGRAIVIPGWINRATAQAARWIPRALMRRIVAQLQLEGAT